MKKLTRKSLQNPPHTDALSTEEQAGTATASPYQPPQLVEHGALGALIRGASWKGVDSTGEIDPENSFPV